VKWKSRHGLRCHGVSTSDAKKQEALQFGVRGETYAYWHLRRLGYIFIARTHASSRAKGKIDLIGLDGGTLIFVEARRRAKGDGKTALPELSITPEKHHVLVRTAHYFLRERHIKECPLRFDVVAIDNTPGHPRGGRLQSRA
jgi:putative endonuclease